MGIDAVSRQSKADILVVGLGPTALEVVKNLVLSGCRKLTIVDDKVVRWEDLSGGFFFTEADVGKKRAESIMYKIKELNIYVKVDTLTPSGVTDEVIKTYNLVFVTEMSLKEQFILNSKCRALNIKFISAECRGAYFRMLNDFGDKFEVLDKNGEEPVEVIIKNITCEASGVVTLISGAKHPF
jgi:molybdopterin/thiamine biosynthesis adenylyltransferase